MNSAVAWLSREQAGFARSPAGRRWRAVHDDRQHRVVADDAGEIDHALLAQQRNDR